jgi:phospholipase C
MRKSIFCLVSMGTLGLACRSASDTTTQETDAGGNAPVAVAPARPGPDTGANPGAAAGLDRLNHVVVIVLENWSFDSLYAEFPGADGLANALKAPPQIDPTTGQPYATLPQTEAHLRGTRVPGIVISPFARKGHVDSTVYDTTSVTALIEHRWNLAPLGTRDAVAADLTNAFDFAAAQ